ncbi:MAG: winged helix DNA-binding domain-containing protein [Chloroflexota bacterium]|nr:winged helix DNA-binding domain-containing protein [Chloroflexota bacterium]MDQ5866203.1 winged helix DNA-binding domain-containing protein [Chloroflexota bacterium]
MRSLTWHEVCERRLGRQHLLERAPASRMVDVVSAVCGAQAQIITAAELTIGARVNGVTQQDVREEIWERRRLIKTYGPRETLHLLPASELPLWMAAMRARESLKGTQWYEASGLEPGQAEALVSGIGEALDGRCLTREELATEVADRAGPWAMERLASTWGELLAPAAYTGRLCFGPSRGSKVTFVRADQWTGTWEELEPDAALAEVLRRYLRAYGPAVHQNFARWFWLKPEQARRVMDSLAGELEEVEVEGRTAYVLAGDADTTPTSEAGPVRLLPQYDCYVLGGVPRDRLVPEAARKRISTHGRGRLEGAVGLPVLLVDGVVAGMWERHVRSKRVELKVEAFVQLTHSQRVQLEAEAARIGDFLGLEAALVLGALD